METPWRIEMLGWLRATQAGQVISRFRSRQTGNLLAYLAYHPHRSHPRALLIELLWPGRTGSRGRSNLRTELAWLRQRLAPAGVPAGSVLRTDGDALRLNPARCLTDVAAFEAALQAAERAGSGTERTQRLADAVRLYQGELLPGHFEAWMMPERLRLEEAFLQAMHELTLEREQAGDLPGALQLAWRAAGVDPLRDETHRDLLRLLAAAGQPESALRQHHERERLLRQEWSTALHTPHDTPASAQEQALRAELRRLRAQTAHLRHLLAAWTADAGKPAEG